MYLPLFTGWMLSINWIHMYFWIFCLRPSLTNPLASHDVMLTKDTLWWECLDQELFRWPHELKGLENQRCEDCEAVPGYAGDVSAPKLPDDVLAVMALNAAWFHYSFWTRQFFCGMMSCLKKHPGVFAKSQVESIRETNVPLNSSFSTLEIARLRHHE